MTQPEQDRPSVTIEPSAQAVVEALQACMADALHAATADKAGAVAMMATYRAAAVEQTMRADALEKALSEAREVIDSQNHTITELMGASRTASDGSDATPPAP